MNVSISQVRETSLPRRRILDTATHLFYAEGVHAVGIDRIIAEARVAKATFYNHFPSKDELVRAYIEEQDRLGRAAIARLPERPPREMVLAIFDGIGEMARQPVYRGCPFINAAAEYPDPANPVRQAIDEHRRWFRDLLRELIAADGHPKPDRTADILVALWDGLLVGSSIDGLGELQTLTRDAVPRVLDARR
jgi:AcrR family transcriptional regulator